MQPFTGRLQHHLLAWASIALLAAHTSAADNPSPGSIFDFGREAPHPGAPAATQPVKVVQVLKLVDEEVARVNKYSFRDGVLFTHDVDSAKMTLPYAPAAEYDLGVDFVRTSGKNDIAITFPVGRSDCTLSLGGNNNRNAWLGQINGVWLGDQNPSLVALPLENNRHYRAVVSVRHDGITAYLDGKLLCQYKTDGHDVCAHRLYKARSSRLLAIGSYRSIYEIHAIDVANIGGEGAVATERGEDGRPINPLAVTADPGGTYDLAAPDATAHGASILFQPSPRVADGVNNLAAGLRNYGGWNDEKNYLSWIVDVKRAGEFTVAVTYSCPQEEEGSEAVVTFDGEAPLPLTVGGTGSWGDFRTVDLGTVVLPVGKVTIALKPTRKPHGHVMDVEGIKLIPVKGK